MAKYMDYFFSDLALGIREMYYTNWQKFVMDFHRHKRGNIEFNYVTAGKCVYYIGNEVVELKKKNLLVINASVPHKLVFTEEEPCLILGFLCGNFPVEKGQVSLGEICESNAKLNALIENFDDYYIISDASELYKPIRQLWDEYRNDKNESYINLTLYKILLDIARILPQNTVSVQDYVKEAKKYIVENYRTIENIDAISSHVGINKSYLQRLFKEKNGIGVWEYLSDIRREVAAQLLRDSVMSIENIYECVGIKSRQTFNTMFFKKYHMSPGEYRKLYKCKK